MSCSREVPELSERAPLCTRITETTAVMLVGWLGTAQARVRQHERERQAAPKAGRPKHHHATKTLKPKPDRATSQGPCLPTHVQHHTCTCRVTVPSVPGVYLTSNTPPANGVKRHIQHGTRNHANHVSLSFITGPTLGGRSSHPHHHRRLPPLLWHRPLPPLLQSRAPPADWD